MSQASTSAMPRFFSLPRPSLAPALVAGASVALAACASPEPLVFDVRVEAASADGSEPVPGATVRVRDEPVGTTDARGHALLRVRGQAGDRVPVSLACPAGARSDAELTLPGAPATSTDDAPALRLACPVVARDAVVLVRVSGDATSLPVKVDGAVVAHTDALGFAHVHVRAGAPAAFEVSLDTSANPSLAPANPSQHFQLERGDELFVFDAAFASSSPARKARRVPGKRRRASDGAD
jgi:hypothetical protein